CCSTLSTQQYVPPSAAPFLRLPALQAHFLPRKGKVPVLLTNFAWHQHHHSYWNRRRRRRRRLSLPCRLNYFIVQTKMSRPSDIFHITHNTT
ncbi:unnamed protein product, partial [Ceratitis capitata]